MTQIVRPSQRRSRLTGERVGEGRQEVRASVFAIPMFIGLFGFVAALFWAMENSTYDVWGGMLLAPLIIALTVPLARRAAAAEEDDRLARLIITALVLKLLASMARYLVAFDIYDGVADAGVYHNIGTDIFESFRGFDFTVDVERAIIGTGSVRYFTGLVYAITGPSIIAGFLVFSWIGFWGLYFFYRAFRTAVPDGNARRYAWLVFFLPSLLFWPSSIGKESLMMFGLGLAAFGTARLMTRTRGGFPLLAAGLLAAGIVRPHVAAVFVAAAGLAYVVRPGSGSAFAPVGKALGVGALVVGSLTVIGIAGDRFGVDELSTDQIDLVLDRTEAQTSQGGSTFSISSDRSPFALPERLVTVLFRPFPQEANNAQTLVAAGEATLLMALAVVWHRNLWHLGRSLRSRPYLVLVIVYTVMFCWFFASLGNFGILARQRVQVLPFFLVLLCTPLSPVIRPRPRRSWRGGSQAQPAPADEVAV